MADKPRICLIDDDIVTRDALSQELGAAGYHVLVAPGAAAGLDLIARHQIDAVVTDLNMPGISGAQLIVEARQRWPDLPIIAITGDLSFFPEGRDIAFGLAADAFLLKPFRTKQLVELLEMVMTGQRASKK